MVSKRKINSTRIVMMSFNPRSYLKKWAKKLKDDEINFVAKIIFDELLDRKFKGKR